jgi:dUTP pyrophosphatase
MQPIAQIIFVPILHPLLDFVDEFNSETERGSGGFGSTDKELKTLES